MSGNRLHFEGLAELRQALRNLPSELTGEASHEVEGAANGAASDIKRAYPVRTTGTSPGPRRKSRWFAPGNLRDGVTVTHSEPGPFVAAAVVKNTSPHAWLYDNGSQTRHWDSGKSTGAMWGKSRPTHLFVSTVIRERKRMYQKLKDLLVRKGLIVSGDAR